jgi:hypothetical protein
MNSLLLLMIVAVHPRYIHQTEGQHSRTSFVDRSSTVKMLEEQVAPLFKELRLTRTEMGREMQGKACMGALLLFSRNRSSIII